MIKQGKIIGVRENSDSMDLMIKIPKDKVVLDNLKRFINCELILKDKESITPKQRKKVYAIIKDISKYIGDKPDNVKAIMKNEYLANGGTDISLKDCSKTEAKEFINLLLDYVLVMGIPLEEHPAVVTEDITHFMYKCIETNKCCICGKEHSQVYTLEQIANNSKDINLKEIDTKKICLCETHLEEYHRLGKKEFMKKYNVVGIDYKEKKIQEELAKAFPI